MPCPFYREDDCGFLGKLREVNGKKIRRQYFQGICWGYWIAVVYIILFVTFLFIRTGRNDFSWMEFAVFFSRHLYSGFLFVFCGYATVF